MLGFYDTSPTVIVSPTGINLIEKHLRDAGIFGHLVIQPAPLGMGDAVLRFSESPAFFDTEDILLIWGDIPFIQPGTVSKLIQRHCDNKNDFTFVTRVVDSAYTVVSRDANNRVIGVVETREMGLGDPQPGERDIGLFIFRKTAVFGALKRDLPGKFGNATGEHGFLYIISYLSQCGLSVEALPIATELDLVSFNKIEDLADFL